MFSWENKNCFLFLLIGWSQFPHLTNKKVGIIRVSTYGSYLSPSGFLCRNVRMQNFPWGSINLSFSWKNLPWSAETSVQWIACGHHHGHPLTSMAIFPTSLSNGIYLERTIKIPVWLEWISHNSQRGHCPVWRNKQSQKFPYLESRAKKVHTEGMQLMIKRKPYLGCCLRISEHVGEQEKRLKLLWEVPIIKYSLMINKPCHGDKTNATS